MEEDQLQRLVETAAGTSPTGAAWLQLWAAIEPSLWRLVDRPRFASHLAHTEDSRSRIITAIHAQLAADRCHYLQVYLDTRRINPRLGFQRWLRTLAKRIGMSPVGEGAIGGMRRRSARRLSLS